MEIPFNLLKFFENVVIKAAAGVEIIDSSFDPQVRVADERFGDFQANGVLPFAKKNGLNPREIAQNLVEKIHGNEFWETSIAGPGFINFKLSPEFLLKWLVELGDTEVTKKLLTTDSPQKIILDFSGPNTAKQMHVGHIRSTIIGESLARLLTLQGHKVIRDNHLGDWGTQFGILLYAIKRSGISLDNLGDEPVATLEDLYRQGNAWVKEDEKALSEARQELVKLQDGDNENSSLWQKIRDLSLGSFDKVYELLDVKFDHAHGESFYRHQVSEVYSALLKHEICKEDQGALVVFHPEHKRFAKQPFIIRKSDGASNYATTDLATISYRVREWNADHIIYVTDGRQRDHFEQLFMTTDKWFGNEKISCPILSHVWFGTILGEDNKAIKTRDGQPVKLMDLLNEAIERAKNMVRAKNPNLTEQEIENRAKAIGLGAVRYADLSQDRTLDYVFSWDKLLALQGNTAPYLQYAVARIHSIFRKAKVDRLNLATPEIPPQSEPEKKLARKILSFPLTVEQTTKELKPHTLCVYLYELATEFSSFYNQEKVMVEDKDIQNLRLFLCAKTQAVLEIGLDILGIQTLEEM
ncbi:MAG: arginine--tRNA ligase [Verrucomicrobiota bacterium]|nr:arginine--tRNA ligase [Verrucomicrobiota bacterium]